MSSTLRATGWVNEQMGGVEYLMYIRELAKRLEGDWDSIKADLQELQQLVLAVEVRKLPLPASCVCSALERAYVGRGPAVELQRALLDCAAQWHRAALQPQFEGEAYMHRAVLQGSYVNLTADSALLTACEPHLDSLLGAISARASTAPLATASWAQTLPRTNEALLVPTQVNYVGKAANLFEDAGAELKLH